VEVVRAAPIVRVQGGWSASDSRDWECAARSTQHAARARRGGKKLYWSPSSLPVRSCGNTLLLSPQTQSPPSRTELEGLARQAECLRFARATAQADVYFGKWIIQACDDTELAVRKSASLELLEGKSLPGIAALKV